MNRFDYIAYDDTAISAQAEFKELIQTIEMRVNEAIKSPRAKALAMTKLEEAYMWIGKGVRDDQIARHQEGQPLQEQRNNS